MKIDTRFKILLVSLILIISNLICPLSWAADSFPKDSNLGVCDNPSNLPATREDARQLVSKIRVELESVEEQIRSVPFLEQVESGKASLEQIAAVAAEQYSIILSDWGSFAQLTARFNDIPSRQFFSGIASGESIALQELIDFAESVGLDEGNLRNYEPRPKAQTYPSRVAWMAANADRAMVGASLLANFSVFGENMERLRDALVKVYGFSLEEGTFFSLFAELPPKFEENAIEVIAAGLIRGACPKEAQTSARILQAYELEFWEAVGEPLDSSLPVVRSVSR